MGLESTTLFDGTGKSILYEKNTVLLLHGLPNTTFAYEVIALTPLGQELVTLLPDRNAKTAAKAVALAIKRPEIISCYLGITNGNGIETPMEVLWQGNAPTVTDIPLTSASTKG